MAHKLQAGDKVKYLNPDTGRMKTGTIHGVRKAEDSNGREDVISYLIDTGEDARLDEITTAEGEDNIIVRQPEQIDIHPNDVQPV